MNVRSDPVWLFDLDNTLHNASHSALPGMTAAMGEFIQRELGRWTRRRRTRLRRRYFLRYGATLLGLMRHHGVSAAHFLEDTHRLPGLEQRVYGHPHDLAALRALPGRKYILTNAPRAYADARAGGAGPGAWVRRHRRPSRTWRCSATWRPKPDARMFRQLARATAGAPRALRARRGHAGAPEARGLHVWMQRWSAPRPGVACARVRGCSAGRL
jgi:putative hydrolase of the HAD superfamily